MYEWLKKIATNEDGLETVEYAIIAGLIVAGAIGALSAIGTWVKSTFENVKNGIGA